MAKKDKYDMITDEMNTNNGVKWRRFIVPKKLNKLTTTYS